MPKTPKNSGQSWTRAEVQRLKREIKENAPTRVMGLKHERTPGAVQGKANEFGPSTKPVNQRPTARRGSSGCSTVAGGQSHGMPSLVDPAARPRDQGDRQYRAASLRSPGEACDHYVQRRHQ